MTGLDRKSFLLNKEYHIFPSLTYRRKFDFASAGNKSEQDHEHISIDRALQSHIYQYSGESAELWDRVWENRCLRFINENMADILDALMPSTFLTTNRRTCYVQYIRVAKLMLRRNTVYLLLVHFARVVKLSTTTNFTHVANRTLYTIHGFWGEYHPEYFGCWRVREIDYNPVSSNTLPFPITAKWSLVNFTLLIMSEARKRLQNVFLFLYASCLLTKKIFCKLVTYSLIPCIRWTKLRLTGEKAGEEYGDVRQASNEEDWKPSHRDQDLYVKPKAP